MDLLWCTGGFNATSSPYGVWEVANYFFTSKVETSGSASRVVVLATHAFEALDMDFRQSLAICPVRPQNIHSLLLKQCLCSAVVSLPSLPNFKEMSSFEELELAEILAAFSEDSLESLEVLELLLPEEVEAEGLLEDDLEGLEGFTCLLSSDLHSQ